MRPSLLNSCFRSIITIKGVGPKVAKTLGSFIGDRVVDLYWHLPSNLIDRSFRPAITEAEPGRIVTLKITVLEHAPPPTKRLPYRVICEDESGELTLVFFHARADYLSRVLPVGATKIVSGRFELFRDTPQMTHPDWILSEKEAAARPQIEAVYPLTAGISQNMLAKIMRNALSQLPALPEWQDPALLKKEGWPDWQQSLFKAHNPESAEDLTPVNPAIQRLAYDELLANQLALALVRRAMRRRGGRKLKAGGQLRAKVRENLPYKLTRPQEQVIKEITTDMASDARMLRLLQGDVGSGKTIVALIAMLAAVEAGAQAALMVPTEILARQHLKNLQPLCDAAGVEIACLTGRDTGKKRQQLLADLVAGKIAILVGTHAIFQQDVQFKDLGLAVIDEQHRFGVHQRLLLGGKAIGNKSADILVMTATPIPRTLQLTAYGDMEVSKITEKPIQKPPIETRAVILSRLQEVINAVGRKISSGEQVYWVCPLVSESEKLDITAAEERFSTLKEQFGDQVALVHGKMSAHQKTEVMTDFVAGRTKLLVATTVIEVGVDVANATVMVIEQAERFGLAQLHQLRGRVGRGTKPGSCLLLYKPPLGEAAKARLKILRETDDGFRIAEEDLRLRGGGEILGTRQSGLPIFRIADLAEHSRLLAIARKEAELILQTEPTLSSERGSALRLLLYLFERDRAIRLISAG